MWCLVSFNIFFTINILPACTARASQLEGRVSILESALAQQEEILVAAQEEMQEKILAADERLGLIETSLCIFYTPAPQICRASQCQHSSGGKYFGTAGALGKCVI